MRYSSIESKIEYLSDIPDVIQCGLLDLFDVSDIHNLPDETKNALRKSIARLFLKGRPVDYEEYCKAYALYYLPVNLQKIWRPLLDLAITDSLDAKCDVLELGGGPGSATFGLTEFYRYLAYDNPSTPFSLTITVVEREKDFIQIFQDLWEEYENTLPENLSASVTCMKKDAVDFLLHSEGKKYGLILESNMLNPNEYVRADELDKIAHCITSMMKRHSSAILIEPAKQALSGYLKTVRKNLLDVGLNCYSPCCCDNSECSQFASARLNISEISLYRELKEQNIINKIDDYHAFEYAVFRNDGLKKYDYTFRESVLSDLLYHDGELVSFKAYILAIADPEKDIFAVKVCEGNMPDNQSVWLNIPKKSLVEKEINALTCGRGGLVDVKNAVVENPKRLGFCTKTRIKIYR